MEISEYFYGVFFPLLTEQSQSGDRFEHGLCPGSEWEGEQQNTLVTTGSLHSLVHVVLLSKLSPGKSSWLLSFAERGESV